MKKFSRCILILLLVTLVGGIGGFVIQNMIIHDQYQSVSQLYVVPGDSSENTLRASDGGLKDDFAIVFMSNVVISDAKKTLGTSDDISQYISVNTPSNSNIVELICTYSDQNTAKSYVDAIAKTAVKTTTIIPVQSIQILTEGTSTGKTVKPNLYRNTAIIAGLCAVACALVELIVLLFIGAFKKKEEKDDLKEQIIRQLGTVSPAIAMNGDVKSEVEKDDIIASEPPVDEIGEYLKRRNEERKAEKMEHDKWLEKQKALSEEDVLAEVYSDYAEDDDVPDSDEEFENHLAKQVAATMEESEEQKFEDEKNVADEKEVANKSEETDNEVMVESSDELTDEAEDNESEKVESKVEENQLEESKIEKSETVEPEIEKTEIEKHIFEEKKKSSAQILGKIRR